MSTPTQEASMLMDIHVLLADDHALLREGCRLLLDAQPGIMVVGEAENGLQAAEMVEALQPDVIVMDLSMPIMDGLEATACIRTTNPGARIIVLTMHEQEDDIRAIVRSGAMGCILKRATASDLIAAVHA